MEKSLVAIILTAFAAILGLTSYLKGFQSES
jgi:hypothetical protein